MKASSLCALMATALLARGQDPNAVALSQAEAVREFPALAQPDSNFNKRFLERLHSLKVGGDSLLLRDDWPEILAKEIGVELDTAPLLPAAAGTPAPSATPWKPLNTDLDPPHSADKSSLDAPAADSKKYYVSGTVLQRTADGLLIECNGGAIGYEAATGEVWLTGKDAAQGKRIKTIASKVGTYTYSTPFGIPRLLDKFQAEP